MPDLVVAVSEGTLQQIFRNRVDYTAASPFDKPDLEATWANLKVTGHVNFSLANGDLELLDDGHVHISELDIVWHTLDFTFWIYVPPICVGGWCVETPWPWPDICFPEWCLFDAWFGFPFNLPADGLHSEVSGTFTLLVQHPPNVWKIILDPDGPIDVDVFDLADSIGPLFHNALETGLNGFLGVPDWVIDLLWDLIGAPIEWLLSTVLDIGDDLQEWLENLLKIDIGLENLLAHSVLTLLDDFSLHEIKEPYELLPADGPNPPVKVKFSSLTISNTDEELIVTVDLLAP
jgi:hypothetical protein